MTENNPININNINKDNNIAFYKAETISYNKNIIPLFNSSIVLKKISESNKNLSLQSSDDTLILNMIPLNNKLSKINNSLKKIHLNSTNSIVLQDKANKFYYFFNSLIKKNELYSLRLEFNNLVYRLNNLINIFYIFNNIKELNAFTNRKLISNIKENLNIVPKNFILDKKTLFFPKHLIKISYNRITSSNINNNFNTDLLNRSVFDNIIPLNNRHALTNFNYKFIYKNSEYLNLILLQQKYVTENTVESTENNKYQLILDKNELNYLLNKLNEIHIYVEFLIEKLNRLNDVFKIKKISSALNNLNNTEVLNINKDSINNNNNNILFKLTDIKNFSLLEFYELFNKYSNLTEEGKNESKDNYIFNLIPYIYNINSDSKTNLYTFFSKDSYNYISSINSNKLNLNSNILPSKENKIKIEETMKSILNKYNIASSNEWILENSLLNSKTQYNSTINQLSGEVNNLSFNAENILNVSRKDYIKNMVNYLITHKNINNSVEHSVINNSINFNWIKDSINHFYKNSEVSKGNLINNNLNLFKGLDDNSPVKINYYPNLKFDQFAKGFILQKLLNNNGTVNTQSIIEESKSEYTNWIETNKRPVINQYLKAMSVFNNRKKGTFIYFTNIFNYSFINNNNKMIKNIYKLLKLVFKSMYSLISKPVYFISPNKIIIHLFYFLLIPNIKGIKKRLKHNNNILKGINSENNLNFDLNKDNNKLVLPIAKKYLYKLINGVHAKKDNKFNTILNNNNNNAIMNLLTLNVPVLANKIINIKNNFNSISKIQNIIIKINIISKLILKNYSKINDLEIKMNLRLKLVELYRIKNRLFLILCLPDFSKENTELVNSNNNLNTICISMYSKFYNLNTSVNPYLNNNSILNSKRYNIYFKNHIDSKLNLIKIFKEMINNNPNLFKNSSDKEGNYLINNLLANASENDLSKLNLSVLNSNVKTLTNKNKNISLLTFKNKVKKNNRINNLKKISKLRNKFNNFNLNKRIKLIKLYNISLINLYPNRFESLCNILNYCFKKNVVLDLTRIHYPYNDANILVNMLAIMIRKISFSRITRKLFSNTIIKNVNNIFYFKNVNLLPAFLTGLKIKLGGKVLNIKSKSRDTVKIEEIGASSPGKINYKDFARFTSKHKRGAYSISVSSGQNFY